MAENPDFISKDEREGTIWGSLIAAGFAAATGGNIGDSLMRAARTGSKAYTGGIDSLLDEKKRNLELQRMTEQNKSSEFQNMLTGQSMKIHNELINLRKQKVPELVDFVKANNIGKTNPQIELMLQEAGINPSAAIPDLTPKQNLVSIPAGGKLYDPYINKIVAEGRAKEATIPLYEDIAVGNNMKQKFKYDPETGKHNVPVGQPFPISKDSVATEENVMLKKQKAVLNEMNNIASKYKNTNSLERMMALSMNPNMASGMLANDYKEVSSAMSPEDRNRFNQLASVLSGVTDKFVGIKTAEPPQDKDMAKEIMSGLPSNKPASTSNKGYSHLWR